MSSLCRLQLSEILKLYFLFKRERSLFLYLSFKNDRHYDVITRAKNLVKNEPNKNMIL